MCDIDEDGGYYAIKGFLYQFDKTILEILDNPEKEVLVEHIQDIEYENYVIQVKHKESQNFSYSKIKKPIIQLLYLFKKNNSLKFCLYCHFKDKTPQMLTISNVDVLNEILRYRKDIDNEKLELEFDIQLRERFIKNFKIVFSEDYHTQFLNVLKRIEVSFGLDDKKDVVLYHSIFRSNLLDIAIKNKEDRKITKLDLDNYIKNTKDRIFYSAYKEYLGKDKYLKMIKDEYFTHDSPNINNFERLFIIDCDKEVDLTTLQKIVNKISKKYYRLKKSPAPYICLRNGNSKKINELKVGLLDDNIIFTDGTCFDGDIFRMDKLIQVADERNKIVVKLIDEDRISQLLEHVKVKEFYHMFLTDNLELETEYSQVKIQLDATDEVLKII